MGAARENYSMETNQSVWKRYQKGYVDDAYVPYLREIVNDSRGNKVSINKWEKQGCVGGLIDPALVRVNKGLTFQRMFEDDPCPSGFKKDVNEPSYCVRIPPRHEQVFFTDKAFIPQNQYWPGYSDGNATRNSGGSVPKSSNTFDLRSVNPLTGNYTVYYNSSGGESGKQTRYSQPVLDSRNQYDTSWYLNRPSSYATLHTTDSYLG